jgi:2-dehydropantoate 2-reductase
MKILMFGRGVIATTYGWAFEQAGHDVQFYVRPGRAEQYGPTVELDLLDARRKIWGEQVLETWPVSYVETLDGDYDLIILSVSHHRLAEAAAALAPHVGAATVLVFGNIWVEPLDAVAGLPVDQLAWGFPGAGGGFGDDGVLRAGLLPTVVLGTLGQPPTEREQAVRDLFRGAGLRITEQPDMRGWLFMHFVFDAGMHSRGLRLGTLSDMIGKRREFGEALLTSRELLPLLTARGVDLSRHRSAVLGVRVPVALTSGLMAWLVGSVRTARRSLEAHTDPHAEEPRAVCADTLAEARRLGVPAPRLEAAERYFA